MSNKVKTSMPEVELADKNWVLKEMKDTENRIEKAFHDQTQYLGQKTERMEQTFRTELATQTRWMIGLMIGMTIAILVAVLFR